MTACLPDVNMLIALTWPNHIHHRQARDWFDQLGSDSWATCPFTQSGFIRVSSNLRIVDPPVTPREALQVLRRLISTGQHVFWPDDLDFTTEAVPTSLRVGHRQVTDAYLLGLAIHHGGQLVTLDQAIPGLLPAGSPDRGAIVVLNTGPPATPRS